jgi:hypothetical protein
MPGQEARRLGGDHPFLDAGHRGLGLAQRQPNRFQPVIALVELQDFVFADHAVVVGNDPELDLDTHARPMGGHCWMSSLSGAGTGNHPRLPTL